VENPPISFSSPATETGSNPEKLNFLASMLSDFIIEPWL
jgi:hypothetical protein